MTMGKYGCHFGRNSTWWKPGQAWQKYIARSQFLLQSGESAADVLCFAGNAAPNGTANRDDGKTVTSNRFGKGQVFWSVSAAEVLAGLHIKPVVQLPAAGAKLAWIQRRTKDADIFFVSNQSNATVRTVVAFRAADRQPEFWDAEQGTIRPATGWTVADGQVNVPLDMAPEKSHFVVFRRQGTPKADPYVRAEGPPLEKPATPSAVPWLAGFDAGKENRLRAWENGSHILHHLPARSGLIWARWR